jgi:Na+/H+ antiporter NhaD/arsenite permease-like protein
MKKLIALLIASAFVMPAFAADKKTAPKKVEKKEVKKHKKAEASMKVADDKPKAPVKKK